MMHGQALALTGICTQAINCHRPRKRNLDQDTLPLVATMVSDAQDALCLDPLCYSPRPFCSAFLASRLEPTVVLRLCRHDMLVL
ncbi:hypothetical protein CDD81_3198 [Ophiocordyceps australis]|uniref:Uncharacterized protein n=1 Tax=Ophiocordyceps australis TaxID=1399860 RepID=A0A2C5XE89_9HYPO|nr:hypothetical protein CDD81_3198 [Ophiocordyceps australis]